ncbi:hypothetical protein [Pedococcus sp. 2YAF34]|uniref:hypothetical protein n=1 Tax=Pedococcus sp. 2YAF34 TaxID=3233032 RepID=UPI003F9A4639
MAIEVELASEQAAREIDKAVTGRRSIARRYVRWVRRRDPEATPAEVIAMLERHYVTAISVAGAAITAGIVAAEVGVSLMPGAAGAKAGAKSGGKVAAKAAAKLTVKAAGQKAAAGAVKVGAQKAVELLPAGDEQLQFEITALFALALADIHGLELDHQQARALVFGLSNAQIEQGQIATMATQLAETSEASKAGGGPLKPHGHKDWSNWANTLADSLPGGAAQSLVRGVQTGVLEDVRAGLDEKQQAAVDYGASALVNGATKFVFGRRVVEASKTAFAEAPESFPQYLDVPPKAEKIDDDQPNRALEALEDAANAVGTRVSAGATAVGNGVTTAAGAVSRPFRRVDRDGDGVPDEAQALTAAKGVGIKLSASFRSKRNGNGGTETAEQPVDTGPADPNAD